MTNIMFQVIMNSYNSCSKSITMKKNDQPAKTIRWSARITGTAFVVLTLVFGIGNLIEGINRKDSNTSFDTNLLFTFFIWGIGLVGLVWALWDEKKGGILSFVSFIIFNILAAIRAENNSATGVLVIFLIPPILYLTYWLMTRDDERNIPKS